MENDFDFILTERALNKITIDNVAAHGIHLLNVTAADQFALRHPVAYQANNVGPGLNKLLDEPRPEQACAAGDENGSISPEGIHSDHTFHGVCSLAQSSFRCWYSR